MSETSSRKLCVPIGSRCNLITQHSDGTWRVWLGINSTNIPIHKALGTYVELRADGSARTVTIRPDGYEEQEIMNAIDT